MDIKKLTQEVLLKNMTPEQQMAVLDSVQASVKEAKVIQKQKIAENVDLVLQALKRIEADMLKRVEGSTQTVEARVKTIKDGKDGKNGADGKAGKDGKDGKQGSDGRDGKDGINGVSGERGQDGVGVQAAHIDFDGSLIIALTNGQELNVGEVVPFDVAEKIRVIGNGGGTSQYVLDTLASLQASIDSISPTLVITDTFVVGSQAAMIALTAAEKGDVAVRTDVNKTFILTAAPYSTLGNWQELLSPTDAVSSVNGYTGTVVLTAADVSAVPYTGATTAVDLNNKTLTNVSRLGINTTAVSDILFRAVGDNNSVSRMSIRGYSSDANSSSVRVTKFRGTTAAPQAPQSGDSLGKFELAGYGTTSSSGYPQASFEGVATEAWGAIARGTKTLIKVTPNGTTTQVTAVTIDQDKTATFAGAISVTGHTTFEGITSTGATGTGKLVYDTSPTLITPLLGTPTSGNLANCTFPTLNQNTTGTASNVTGTVAIANGGTGATTAGAALTALGAYAASNPSGYTNNTGTVTSITAGTGLSGGTITTSGTVALANTTVTAGAYTSANITIDAQGRITAAANGTAGTGTVTSVAALTLGTTGTDVSSTVATGTTTPVITLNVPTASAANRGALSSTDWSTFNGKQATLVSGTTIKTVNGTSILGSGNIVTTTAPTVTVYTSGSGTYTTPANTKWLSVQLMGGGGGGAGSSATGGTGGTGGTTSFGSAYSLGGSGGTVNASVGGAGGACTAAGIGTGLELTGGNGTGGVTGGTYPIGGAGASSAFGGGGSGSGGSSSGTGGAGVSNTGGGGGGAGTNTTGTFTGSGGGSGGYLEIVVASPSATYSYAVGAGGASGSAGSGSAGGAGGSGVIKITAYF